MALCRDCVGDDYCNERPNARRSVEKLCRNFKNKADFVEVVRCKDCKHANYDGTICRYSVGRAVEPEHFCSYGERKDT